MIDRNQGGFEMSYEVTFEKNTSVHKLEKNIVTNDGALYKLRIEKEIVDTDAIYQLDLKCFEKGVDVKTLLPHEAMMELDKMISNSLSC